jgi:hypothetical protein
VRNNELQPGELSIHKTEHEINENLDRFSESVDDLTKKLERPVEKVESFKQTLRKIEALPWGIFAVGTAFTIGFLLIRKR